MPKFLEVVIFGKSLLVAGLAASLKGNSAFRVTYMDLPIAAVAATLALIVPDVVCRMPMTQVLAR